MCSFAAKTGTPAVSFHILELVAAASFNMSFGPSSGPDIDIFKRFQSSWNFIDHSEFKPLMPGDLYSDLADVFLSCKEQVVLFCIQNMEFAQPRYDYHELLQFDSCFRWLSSKRILIYSAMCPAPCNLGGMHDLWIKMYLFRNQFWLTAKELAGLKHFTAFTGILYIKAWFAAPSAIAAPAGNVAGIVKRIGLISWFWDCQGHQQKFGESPMVPQWRTSRACAWPWLLSMRKVKTILSLEERWISQQRKPLHQDCRWFCYIFLTSHFLCIIQCEYGLHSQGPLRVGERCFLLVIIASYAELLPSTTSLNVESHWSKTTIKFWRRMMNSASTSWRLLSGISISFRMQRQGLDSNMTPHNWLFIGPVNNTLYFMLLFSTVDKSIWNKKRFLIIFWWSQWTLYSGSHTCSKIAIFTPCVTVVKIGVNN